MTRALIARCAALGAALVAAGILAGCSDGRGGSGSDAGRDGSTGGGSCDSCLSGQACCDDFCVDLSTNPSHCGTCGHTCPSGMCSDGTCVSPEAGTDECDPLCSSSERCCSGECVNRQVSSDTLDGRDDSSFDHCNGCGLACDEERASRCASPSTGGPPQCLCGTLEECAEGQVCVEEDDGTWNCIDLSSNPDHCGEIGNECPDEEICNDGECVCGSTGGPCGEGTSCCGGSCIDTSDDPMNCGGCGNTCGDQADSCVDGTCKCGDGPKCEEPSDGSLGELCCTGSCVPQNDSNCGSCGNMCSEDTSCIEGTDPGGGTRICCGISFPGFPGTCTDTSFDGGIAFDGGF